MTPPAATPPRRLPPAQAAVEPVRRILRRLPPNTADTLLLAWFATISTQRLSVLIGGGAPGFDGRLYREAAAVWLAGGDPWSVSLGGTGFAAPPTSLLFMAPFVFLPEATSILLIVVLGLIGTAMVLRRLQIPLWFLAFPPFVDAAWNANPDVLILPLLYAGIAGPAAAALAKSYALVPVVLLGRRREAILAGVVLVVTAPLLPWAEFLSSLPEISEQLRAQSSGGMSATVWPPLVPIAVVGLIFAGRQRAAWLAVPAMWPFTQWYYATLALPAFTRRSLPMILAAALLSVPIQGLPVLAVVAAAAGQTGGLRARWKAADQARPGSRSTG